MRLVFVVLVVACFWHTTRSITTISPGLPPAENCKHYKSLITDLLVTVSASFLADNPRGTDPALNPQRVRPHSPDGLFRAYYGVGASAEEFKKAILDMVYLKFGKTQKMDRNQLRRNIALYVSAGSFNLARHTMGQLLFAITGDYAGLDKAWVTAACLAFSRVQTAETALGIEFSRLRNEVGDLEYGSFLAVGSGKTLAFVIDDTGSMGGEIRDAQQRVNLIIDHLQNSLDRPQSFVLVPFNDPRVGPLTVTRDPNTFKAAINKLFASGGGDAPELCLRGIQIALENCRAGSIVYVITDVHAKDYHLQDAVIAQAKQRKISIVFMLTNDLAYCSPVPDQRYSQCQELYKRIAQETGGKVFVTSKHSFFKATEIVQNNVKQGIVVLKQVSLERTTGANHRVYFDVDSSVSELFIEAVGGCGENGPIIRQPGSSNQTQMWTVGDLYSASVDVSGNFGKWFLVVGIVNNCDITISGRSTFGFLSNSFVKVGGEGISSFERLDGIPSAADQVMIILDAYGSGGNRTGVVDRVRFMDSNGRKEIGVLPVESQSLSDLSYKIGVQGPPHPFSMVVEGHEILSESLDGQDRIKRDLEQGQGRPFSRVVGGTISTSNVTVSCNLSEVVFRPGVIVTFKVAVTNFGANDSFLVSATDTMGFVSLLSHAQVRIAHGQTKFFNLHMLAPGKTKEGVATDVTFTAKGNSPGSFQYSTCTAVVGQKSKPRVDSLSVNGLINSRFAETVVTSIVTNDANVAREAKFDVILPVDAFIINVTMHLDNETIVGQIEEKEKAKKIYDQAKKKGKAAGHVAVRDKSVKTYRTSMFVEPRKKITFQLTYQQLLRRVRGKYDYVISISPHAPVKRLTVNVHIVEDNPIHFVEVLPFLTKQTNVKETGPPPGTQVTLNKHDRRSAHIRYTPNLSQQTAYSPLGLSGTYRIQYDVERSYAFGDIVTSGGYFAHFYSAPTLTPIPKLVVFVIDTSGSMSGHKISQTKKAFSAILRTLNPDDYFNMVFFDSRPVAWVSDVMSPATPTSIEDAIVYLNQQNAGGSTGMTAAIEMAYDLLGPFLVKPGVTTTANPRIPSNSRRIRKREAELNEDLSDYMKMIVLMSDGQPDSRTRVTSLAEERARQYADQVKVHTIGFGSGADMTFLKKLALINGGESRRVFEDLNAVAQVFNFFEEVANALVKNLVIEYPPEKVKDLTVNSFSILTSGSEVVLAGRFEKDLLDATGDDPLALPFRGQITGDTLDSAITLDFDVDPKTESRVARSTHKIDQFTERLWAFLKIKELLNAAALADEANKTLFNEQALNMSLKYNFVTPLTSLVVIRSEDRKQIEEDLKDAEKLRKQEEQERLRLIAAIWTTTTTTRAPPPPPMRHLAYDGSRSGGGGFYGDPHFVVPLREDTKLCFNWDGKDNEIYNLFYNPVSRVTVNGLLIVRDVAKLKKPGSFISKLAIYLPERNFRIIVTPYNVTIWRNDYSKLLIFNVTYLMTFTRKGISVKFLRATHSTAKIQVFCYGLIFNMKLVRRRPNMVDHLDFSMTTHHISEEPSDGVIGQFLNADVRLEEGDQDMAYMEINSCFGMVSKAVRRDPVTGTRLTCWFSYGNARDLIRGNHQRYLVEELFEIPQYQTSTRGQC